MTFDTAHIYRERLEYAKIPEAKKKIREIVTACPAYDKIGEF